MKSVINIFVGILAGIIAIIVIVSVLLSYFNKPLSRVEVNKKISAQLEKVVDRNKSLSSALFTIYSKETGYFEQFAVGTKNFSSDQPVTKNSRFHSASVGKTMCAAVFGILADEGRISLDDKISLWLDDSILEGLFVVDGINHSDQVTIRHLLTHTSGVGDYFEDPVISGKTMLELITDDPDIIFTPEDLIAFTRDNQKPVGKPGQQFHYSDTGYTLLGLILEKIENKPYAQILKERIFDPLGMDDSCLWSHIEKPADIVGVYANGIDYSSRNALSLDWAGGGIVTTMDDLLTFMMALENGDLVSEGFYRQMTSFDQKFNKGIYYGMGMMYFDFSEMSFLMESLTGVYGGIGATGTYMFYDKERDTYYIANFGSLGFVEKSIQELIKIKMIYDRMYIE